MGVLNFRPKFKNGPFPFPFPFPIFPTGFFYWGIFKQLFFFSRQQGWLVNSFLPKVGHTGQIWVVASPNFFFQTFKKPQKGDFKPQFGQQAKHTTQGFPFWGSQAPDKGHPQNTRVFTRNRNTFFLPTKGAGKPQKIFLPPGVGFPGPFFKFPGGFTRTKHGFYLDWNGVP